MGAYEDTEKKIAAVPPLDPNSLRPKWYDRLLGGGVGFLAGYGNAERGAQLGGAVTNRRYTEAKNERSAQISPLLEQLNAEREEIPMLNSANESAWRQFQGAQDAKKLDIQQNKADTDREYKQDIVDIRQQIQAGNIQKASDLLDQKQKELAERQKRGEDTRNYRDGLLDLKQQMQDWKEKHGSDPKPARNSSLRQLKTSAMQHGGKRGESISQTYKKLGLSQERNRRARPTSKRLKMRKRFITRNCRMRKIITSRTSANLGERQSMWICRATISESNRAQQQRRRGNLPLLQPQRRHRQESQQ
jgi:hypothetical protein